MSYSEAKGFLKPILSDEETRGLIKERAVVVQVQDLKLLSKLMRYTRKHFCFFLPVCGANINERPGTHLLCSRLNNMNISEE